MVEAGVTSGVQVWTQNVRRLERRDITRLTSWEVERVKGCQLLLRSRIQP